MSNRRVEKYIPDALKVLEKEETFKNNIIPKVFKGYISSFGASIVQSGLIPTLAFYLDKESGAQSKRCLIPEFIYNILVEKENDSDVKDYINLFDYALNSNEDYQYKKDIIKDASVALKLVMNTFEFKEEGEM